MAIFKYQKYLAINIDFVNVLKNNFLFQNFFNRKRFLCVLHMTIFKYKKYLVININFVNVLKNNFLFQKFFNRKRFLCVLHMAIFKCQKYLAVIFENQFKLVLKLSLKDQILINFTKPNPYFSYVSEHDSWALISLSWDLMTLFFSEFATCRLCICLIFELAMLVQLNQ